MNEEIDVGEILNLARTEFNLSFSFDISKMRNLFEQLCMNIQRLQNDIDGLKKDIQSKPMQIQPDSVKKEIESDQIVKDVKEEESKSEEPKAKESDQTDVKSEEAKTDENDQKEVKSEEPKTVESDQVESKPQPPITSDDSDELKRRLSVCEDKIMDFDKRFDQLSKYITTEFPNGNNSDQMYKNNGRGQTRHELFEDFLDEFDGTKKKGEEKDEEKKPLELAEGNSEEEEGKKDESKDQKESAVSNNEFRHDDTLDTFLDAAKIEIENAKKVLSEDFNHQMKDNNAKLNGSIVKTAADFDTGLKKVSTKISDAESKLNDEIREMNKDRQRELALLRANVEELTNQVKSLENRVESNAKASEMSKESLKKLVTDDGKIDPKELLEQLEQHLRFINDMDGRLITLENRPQVSVDAFNVSLSDLKNCEDEMKRVESMLLSSDAAAAEMKEEVERIKKEIENRAMNESVRELENAIRELQEDSKDLRESALKNNKDIINVRAAINTLRNHSEETRSIADDAMNAIKQACEMVESNDRRLKKMLVFMKDENNEILGKINELSTMVERGDEQLTELQKQHENDIERLEAERSNYSSDYDSDESSTPKPNKPSKIPPVEKSETATSPHTSLTLNFDASAMDTQLPSPPPLVPQIQAKPIIPTQTPPLYGQQHQQQFGYEQPTNAQRKLIESSFAQTLKSGKNPASSALPRLAQQQAKREIEALRMDLKRYDDIFPRLERIESKLTAIKSTVDSLGKQSKALMEGKAERSELQSVFEQFRMAMGELNNRIGSIRKSIMLKADIAELKEVQRIFMSEMVRSGETAAGTEVVRCLTCGQPRSNITGAIDDPSLAKALGNAVSSRVCGADGQGNVCFVYGEHGEMYLGRSADGRPICSRHANGNEDENTNQNIKTNGGKSTNPPLTAPSVSRKVIDAQISNS